MNGAALALHGGDFHLWNALRRAHPGNDGTEAYAHGWRRMNFDPDQSRAPPPPAAPVYPTHGIGQIGESPLILGYAGLLPQIAATAVSALDPASDIGPLFAFGYAALILSFLGGIWWGFAMCRQSVGQGRLATIAVVPPILAAFIIMLAISRVVPTDLALVLLGSGVLLTLLVDRRLADSGIAPAGWMAMRVPLSIGLGVLTIACGFLD